MTDITKLPLFVIREMWLDGELSDADYTAEVQRRNDEIISLRSRAEKAEALSERLKLEAQGHAMEARTANSTIAECYQAVTGGKGEPGNWHGAEPVRQYVARAEATCEKLSTALERIPVKLRRMALDKFEEGKQAASINIRNAAQLAEDIAAEALSAYRNVTTVNASGPKGETPENCRDGGADAQN